MQSYAPDVEQRLNRERDFHNARFAGGEREAQQKFYDAIDPSLASFWRQVRDLARDSDILELGCASGANLLRAIPDFRSATGVDISDVAVEQAKAAAKAAGRANLEFLAGDAEATGLPDESFDVVFGSGIVHHLDIARCAAETARLLRPGGHAIFAEPLGYNPLINLYRGRTPQARTPDEHPLLRRDLANLSAPFAASRIEFIGLTAIGAALFHRTPAFTTVRWLTRGLDSALLSIPGLRWMAWFSVITLRKQAADA